MAVQTPAERAFRLVVQKIKALRTAIGTPASKVAYVGIVTADAAAPIGSSMNPYASVADAVAGKDMADLRVAIAGTYVNATDHVALTKDNLLITGSTGLAGGYDATLGNVSSNGHNRLQVTTCSIGNFTFGAGTGHKLEKVNVTADGSVIALNASGSCSLVNVDFGGKTLSITAAVGANVYITDCANLNITAIGAGVTVVGSRCTGKVVNSAGVVGFAASENLRVTGAGTNRSPTSSYTNATVRPSTAGLYILNYAYASGLTEVNGAALAKGDGIWYLGTVGSVANCCVRMFTYEQVSTVTVGGITWLKSAGGWIAPAGSVFTKFSTVTYSSLAIPYPYTDQIPDGGSLNVNSKTAIAVNTPSGCTFTSLGLSTQGALTFTGKGTVKCSGNLSVTGSYDIYLTCVSMYLSGVTISAGTLKLFGGDTTRISASSGPGSAATTTVNCNIEVVSGMSAQIDFYSDGVGVSKFDLGPYRYISGYAQSINLIDKMPVGVFTLIASTNATAPAAIPVLGTNSSGRTAVLSWVAGTGLCVTLT